MKPINKNKKMFKAALIASSLVTASALSEIPERARSGKAWEIFLSKSSLHSLTASEPLIFTSKVDNFNVNNSETFSQRYYVNSQYWDGKGPIFLSIGGEGLSLHLYFFFPHFSTSSSYFDDLGTLNGPPGGYVSVLGKQYSALLVSLEHR